MGTVLPVALSVMLAAAPAQQPRALHPGALALGVTAAVAMGVGLGLELHGRLRVPPGTPLEAWDPTARFDVVGGTALLGAGLCLLTLSALVLQHRTPALEVWAGPGGGGVRLGVRF